MEPTIILIKDTGLSGADKTRDMQAILQKGCLDRGLDGKAVQVVRAMEIGMYNCGVVIKILPRNIVYVNVQENDLAEIVEKTIASGQVITRLQPSVIPEQFKIVLRNCGQIDPESLQEYLQVGGYQ